MESRSIKIKSRKNKNISIKVIPGHFATNHSHINYYIDMTGIKYHMKAALEAGEALAEKYATNLFILFSLQFVIFFIAHRLAPFICSIFTRYFYCLLYTSRCV